MDKQKIVQEFIDIILSCTDSKLLADKGFGYTINYMSFNIYFNNVWVAYRTDSSTNVIKVPEEDIELYLKVLKKVVNDINAEEKIKKERKRQENLKCLEKMINE